MPPILEARDVTQAVSRRERRRRCGAGRLAGRRAGRVRGVHGPVGLRQEHAAPPAGRAGPADVGRRRARRRRSSADCRTTRPRSFRREKTGIRLPVLQPHPASERLGERGAPVHDRRGGSRATASRPTRSAPRSTRWTWTARSATGPTSSRPASSSASRSPARSSAGRRSCSRTSRPGNLDFATGTEILDRLWRSCHEGGQTVVLVTHDAKAAAYADRVYVMHDGSLRDEIRPGPPRGPRGRPADRPAHRPGPLSPCAPSTRSLAGRWSRGRSGPSSRSPGSPSGSACSSRRSSSTPGSTRPPSERPRPARARGPASRGVRGERPFRRVARGHGHDAGRRGRRAGARAADLPGSRARAPARPCRSRSPSSASIPPRTRPSTTGRSPPGRRCRSQAATWRWSPTRSRARTGSRWAGRSR